MRKELERQLEKHFGYKTFRTGQIEIISDVLDGKDVLGILPTGSGKSLCYQLPSLLLPHLTVVISPLISLMIDQVRETKAFHFKEVVALHSLLTYEEKRTILNQLDDYKIIYISPELIQNRQILNALIKRKVSLFVIDEAHCISQWGYDFRPDYLRLTDILIMLDNPTILALSGTITPDIEKDIMTQLNRPHMIVHKYPMDRKNISLVVEKINRKNSKNDRLIEILQLYNVPTIIYFSSRKRAEEIAHFLSVHLTDRNVAYYHGDLDPESRLKIQQQFFYDQLQIVCATSAFGMGINKPNIRLVIHYHLPTQKESFIQEIGRAGRDGKESVSVLLFEPGDELIPLQLVENEVPSEKEIRHFLNYLYLLYEKNKPLPRDDFSLSEKLSLSETKLKLLKYHLETHGIIESNHIRFDQKLWNDTFQEILEFSDHRKNLKTNNVMKMLAYVHANRCLRTELYKEFQTITKSKKENCCTYCGFSWPQLHKEPHRKPLHTQPEDSWQKKLANLLEIGEFNES